MAFMLRVYSFRLSVRPFFRPFVCSFVHSLCFRHVRGITSKFYVKVSQNGYILATTYQKAFIFGPWRVSLHSVSSGPRVHATGWGWR